MLPATIVIQPLAFDALAAFGIGGLAVVVALAWVVLFAVCVAAGGDGLGRDCRSCRHYAQTAS